jgi:hypothetical protein
MRLCGRLIDLTGLVFLNLAIVGVLLRHLHQCEHTVTLAEGDLLTFMDTGSQLLLYGQCDGHRPDDPVSESYLVDAALVVGLPHEAGKGAEGTGGEKLQVRESHPVKRDLGHPFSSLAHGGSHLTAQHTID